MKAKITYEQVVETIQGLIASGVKPTLRVIADRLGGGSMSTVHKYFKQYREGLQSDMDYKLSEDFYKAVKAEIMHAVEEAISESAVTEKESELYIRDLLDANQTLENDNEVLSKEVRSLTNSLLVEQSARKAAEKQIAELTAKLEEKDRAIGERDFRLASLTNETSALMAQALSMGEVLEIYRKQIDIKPQAPVKTSKVAKLPKAANKGKTPSTPEQVTA